MDLITRVRRFVARHELFDRGTRVVAAVSGGSDSVALAHLVRELSDAGHCGVAGVVHFNHQLRASADRDEELVSSLAGRFGWPIVIDREDVAARARRERRSIEHAARTARHEFFERARAALGGDVVALGHTRDDQAETFLLRLLRGAGPKGLAAMHPRRGIVVRPLLSCRRGQLRAYLAERDGTYVDDESNGDVAIPRNRVRLELLPMLEKRFNPSVVDVLAGESELIREIWRWMEGLADGATAAVDCGGPGGPAFDVEAMLALPPPLRRLVLWRALSAGARGGHVTFEHVDASLELLRPDGPRSADIPGHRLERVGPAIVLRTGGRSNRRSRVEPANFFEYPLSIPGEVSLPEAGCVLAAESSPQGFDLRRLAGEPNTAAVRRDRCAGPLRVRSRRPGDRFRPLGLGGQKKLQDYFVDRKIDRHRRDQVPLVVDDRDRIVWVAGLGIDEAFRVTDPAQAVVILRLKHLGGPA